MSITVSGPTLSSSSSIGFSNTFPSSVYSLVEHDSQGDDSDSPSSREEIKHWPSLSQENIVYPRLPNIKSPHALKLAIRLIPCDSHLVSNESMRNGREYEAEGDVDVDHTMEVKERCSRRRPHGPRDMYNSASISECGCTTVCSGMELGAPGTDGLLSKVDSHRYAPGWNSAAPMRRALVTRARFANVVP